jgi:6-aminohexanoate-oligomer endohydrolase
MLAIRSLTLRNVLAGGVACGLALGSTDAALSQDARPRYLEFDFSDLLIGVAEYEDGPTGTTVFYFPNGVVAAADVRGGSPGTVNAHAVRLAHEKAFIDAVVFSGGSWYGLAAATGVANAIKAAKEEQGDYTHIAGVLGGIIFDVGNRRFSRVAPDHELGAEAFRTAVKNRFPLGARGAGRFAMQGIYYYRGVEADRFAGWPHSGQGAAFRQLGPTKIAVFTVVNSLGTIVGRDGRVLRCHRHDPAVTCPHISELISAKVAEQSAAQGAASGPTSNTTLTLVVTNQKMPFAQLQRLAVQVHTSMGRAIQPFATDFDGDVLYAVTTNEIENADLSPVDLAFVASEIAWDAVLSSLPSLPSSPQVDDPNTAVANLHQYEGMYVFPDGSHLTIQLDGQSLSLTFSGRSNIYFDGERLYHLNPAGDGRFIISTAARDVLEFGVTSEGITSVVINPGRWPIVAELKR